jgi:predicted PolB exonuclease-like 3'-5' exonuclease
MKKLFFDIETLPADESKYEILKKVYDKKKKKLVRFGQKIGTFENFIESTGLDGTYGRVFCISYAINDGPVQCLSGNEIEIIKKFWEKVFDIDLFIGFNILDFDLKFLYQRSIILSIEPSRNLSFARFRSEPIFDVMYEWSKWNTQNKVSLDSLAQVLGIPSSKKELEGSRVYNYYKKGKYSEIRAYCNADVEVLRKIYKRMMFEK